MTAYPSRPGGRKVARFAALVIGVVLLHLAGRGQLAPPPLHSVSALTTWASTIDPATMAVVFVRLLAEVAGLYLLAIVALHLIGDGLRLSRATSLADALSTPATRRLVRGGLGLGLATSAAISGVGAEPTVAPGTPGAVMRVLDVAPPDDVAAPDGGRATMTPIPAGTATMTPVGSVEADESAAPQPAAPPPATPTASTEPTATMAPVAPPEPSPLPETSTVPGPTTWTVSAGDSMWSIAADVLHDDLGATPSADDVGAYWRTLIDTNRDRLVDPADPDLIMPGQVFELPPPPVR